MMKKTVFLFGLCCLLMGGAMLAGCAAKEASAWREYKVFCGMSSGNGEVSEEAWRRFCDRHVSAAFPDGYTVLDAAGYWRPAPEVTARERAKVILIVAPADARDKVLAVARQYQKEFVQGSVLVSGSETDIQFVQTENGGGDSETRR